MHRHPGPAKRPEETPGTKMAHSGRYAADTVPSTKKPKVRRQPESVVCFGYRPHTGVVMVWATAIDLQDHMNWG